MNSNIFVLIVLTIAWAAITYNQIIPILRLPLAKSKREFVLLQTVIGVVSMIAAWVTINSLTMFTLVMLMLYQSVCTILFHLLAKLDYYIDDLLQEVLLLTVLFGGSATITSIWHGGIDLVSSVMVVRLSVVLVGALFIIGAKIMGRSHSGWWAIMVYVVLMLAKWITVPLWGVWSLILIFVYSVLAGYVAHWMATTTYAEKVLAWNISPAKTWGVLVIAAGVLVLAF